MDWILGETLVNEFPIGSQDRPIEEEEIGEPDVDAVNEAIEEYPEPEEEDKEIREKEQITLDK